MLPEFTDADLDALRTLLDQEADEGALDLVATHGMLTAISISPTALPAEEWLEALFDGPFPEVADAAAQRERLLRWQQVIAGTLAHGELLPLPCPLVASPEGDTPLTDWCIGFMEGMFLREDDWYTKDEDYVADLTLPMVVISDLIDDPDMQSLRRDRKLLKEMSAQIPDVVSELYLFFHGEK